MGQHFADVRIFPERAVRNADADRQLARPGIGMDKVQCGHFFQDALCHGHGRILSGPGQNDGEFFAAVPEYPVRIPQERFLRGLRHGFQGGVPGLMPEPVIVVLEEVEVEHQQGERRARRDALHRFLKRPAVVYAGQRIPEAEVSILVPFLRELAGTMKDVAARQETLEQHLGEKDGTGVQITFVDGAEELAE